MQTVQIRLSNETTLNEQQPRSQGLGSAVVPDSDLGGYPRVLGTPVPKSLVFWVPKTLKALNTTDWGKWNHP